MLKELGAALFYILLAGGYFGLVFLSQKWGGNYIFPVVVLLYIYFVSGRLVKIKQIIKEIRLSAVMNENSSLRKKIVGWRTVTTILCYLAGLLVSCSFFLFFYSVDDFYKLFIFIDLFFMLLLVRNIKIPFSRHIKEKPLILVQEFGGNFVNIFVLFAGYVLYSFYAGNMTDIFQAGEVDASIPLWVKQNIHHSCDIFEKILRISVLIQMTIENIVSVESWTYITYKTLHLLTMSFLPFLGITLFYRCLLSVKPPFLTSKDMCEGKKQENQIK